MANIQRKKRPLSRDRSNYRDDRLFIIACDDTYAPKQYFDFFRITRLQIHVVPTENGESSAERVLGRLLQYKLDAEPDDELWMLLDTDHYIQREHLRSFVRALRNAKDAGVKIALSRPCFEIWLLLHHLEEDRVRGIPNADLAVQMLRNALGCYNKTNLRMADYPVSSVATACERARRLDGSVLGGTIPKGCTTRVYQIWDAIVSETTPDQLSETLRRIVSRVGS